MVVNILVANKLTILGHTVTFRFRDLRPKIIRAQEGARVSGFSTNIGLGGVLLRFILVSNSPEAYFRMLNFDNEREICEYSVKLHT